MKHRLYFRILLAVNRGTHTQWSSVLVVPGDIQINNYKNEGLKKKLIRLIDLIIKSIFCVHTIDSANLLLLLQLIDSDHQVTIWWIEMLYICDIFQIFVNHKNQDSNVSNIKTKIIFNDLLLEYCESNCTISSCFSLVIDGGDQWDEQLEEVEWRLSIWKYMKMVIMMHLKLFKNYLKTIW